MVTLILVQTLWFKFSDHPDSIYIQVNMEPYGRIGIMGLIVSVLVLMLRTIWLGVILVLGIIGGAIIMHLIQLGVEVNGDSGKLFNMEVVTFMLSLVVLFYHRKDIPFIGKMF